MNRCWNNQKYNLFYQENLQGHQSYNENSQKLNKKTYLNPQIVNYELLKNSLSKGCLKRSNKIHVNPNFKGPNGMTNENYPHMINTTYLNSQNSLWEPGTSNTHSAHEEKTNTNLSLITKEKNTNSATVIQNHQNQSRFKKVNVLNLKSSNKYSWSKNKTKEGDLNFSVEPAKSVDEKIIKYNFNTYKYTSPKVFVNQICKSQKNRIFRSKTKIINESKTKLLSSASPKAKLHFKERKLHEVLKKSFNSSKFPYENSKESSVLRVARAVRSKYKYLNNLEQYKKTKYKIDKRIKVAESVRKKSSAKEVRDIRKLFPNYFYNKVKISPYNIYNLNKCQSISKNKFLLRKNQVDKINKNINRFQNRQVVKIGGILYKSTTTKLTLASQKVQINSKKLKLKRNCVVYVRGEKFTLENNGRALKRQVINDKTPLLTPKRIDIGGVTYLRKSNNVLIRTNVHQARHFVNKAKNKSIAVLTNLNKRSTMPCMIYHRFGRCNRHSKGLCMYKHDPKNIAVCKKFLKGECSDNTCLLSHQIIQEKMATCHFFLKGLCMKENCPFLHVKLSKKAAICINFLQGFCNLGKECPKRHLHQCPEFDKYGTCNLGSKCHYPHKKLPDKSDTESLYANKPKPNDETVQYYLHSEVRKKPKKTKQSIAKLKETPKGQKRATKNGLSVNSLEESKDTIECFPKRIKLDQLPCFIPLNSGS